MNKAKGLVQLGKRFEMTTENKDKINEENIITLEFDEGEDLDCEVLGTFLYENIEYIVLNPQDDTEDLLIYEFIPLNDEEFEIKEIEDDELFEALEAELEKFIIEEDE